MEPMTGIEPAYSAWEVDSTQLWGSVIVWPVSRVTLRNSLWRAVSGCGGPRQSLSECHGLVREFRVTCVIVVSLTRRPAHGRAAAPTRHRPDWRGRRSGSAT